MKADLSLRTRVQALLDRRSARSLAFAAVAALALAAFVAARLSSPELLLLSGPQAWREAEAIYGLLMVGWACLLALLPPVGRLSGRLSLLAAVGLGYAASVAGYGLLPIGGYDLPAKMTLYTYSILSGAVFAVASAIRRHSRIGTVGWWAIAGADSALLLVLLIVFTGARMGALSGGPALATSGKTPEPLASRILYQAPANMPSYLSLEPYRDDGQDTRGSKVVALAPDGYAAGDGVIVDLDRAEAKPFDLSQPLLASSGGASPASSSRAYLQVYTLSPAWRSDIRPTGLLTLSGTGEFYFDGSVRRAMTFTVELDCDSAVATVKDFGLPDAVDRTAPGCQLLDPRNARVAQGSIISPSDGGAPRRLVADRGAVTLLQGDQTIWRLRVPLYPVLSASEQSYLAWARSTATGGVVFAVNRLEWREPNRRGSFPGYPVFTVYYVGP